MSQPTVKKVEDEQPEVEASEEETTEVQETVKQIKGATVLKPHVAQTTKRSSLTHQGVVSGKKYIFPSSKGRSKDNLRWIAIDPRDAEKYKFMADKNHDWHFDNREVRQIREAHYVTYNGTEGSSVKEIEFPMFDHNKKDPDKRDRVYHFVEGDTIEIAAEDAERFEAKASGTKAWTYSKKTIPVGGS